MYVTMGGMISCRKDLCILQNNHVQVRGQSGGGLVAQMCPTLMTAWTVACQAPLSM